MKDAPRPIFELFSGSWEAARNPSSDELATEELLVQLDVGLLQGNPDAVTVPLADGHVATFQRVYWSWTSTERYSWIGEVDFRSLAEGRFPGSLSLHAVDGRLFGRLESPDGTVYRLVADGGFHRLVASEPAAGSTCGVGYRETGFDLPGQRIEASAGAGPEDSQTKCTVPPSEVPIDVMVLYPRNLESSAQSVRDYAHASVAESNAIFGNSGVGIDYNLVYLGPITGEQPPEAPETWGPMDLAPATEPVLDWLNGQFAGAVDTELELLRRAHGADLVSIVIPQHPHVNCGIATPPSSATASRCSPAARRHSTGGASPSSS